MTTPPVEDVKGLVHFTGDTTVYAGHHFHEGHHVAHTHSFMEIALVFRGVATHDCVVGRRQLQVGDLVLLRPGVWHSYDDCRGLDLFNCCFSIELLRHELAWTREDPLLSYLLWTAPSAMDRRGVLAMSLDPDEMAGCLPHLEALQELRSKSAAHHRADSIAQLLMYLGHLARAMDRRRLSTDRRSNGPTHPAVIQGMRLLEEQLAEPWTLSDLADELHLAPSYLVRLFRATVGLPPMAYLAQQRAETAAGLLLHTGQTISQIGQEVGWSDATYFARRFKAHFGVSASDYRQRFTHRNMITPVGPGQTPVPK
jgi:AraC family L-rhamnose operon transcriptional activator RhaR